MPPKKKPAPAWLKDKDLLNPKHGRDKLIDRLRVRPNPAKAPASLPLIHSLTPAHSSCRAGDHSSWAACCLRIFCAATRSLMRIQQTSDTSSHPLDFLPNLPPVGRMEQGFDLFDA